MKPDYYWLNEDSRRFLNVGYLKEGVSPEERIAQIAKHAEEILGIEGFADKFIYFMKRGFYSLASPVWANFGERRGLPISCNGVVVEDTMESILYKTSEVGMQTKYGSGTSGYFGNLRPRGAEITDNGKSFGSVHFMELFDSVSRVVSQGGVRRGSFAAYLPADHGDILEFLKIRDEGHAIQKTSLGVCISDDWMQAVLDGDVEKREVWGKIIKKRFETGYPYLFFTDNANNQAPQAYKNKGKKIYASNLCNEIALHSSEDESFVCCLSSLNLAQWDEMESTDAVGTLVEFLDAVMEEYIQKTKDVPLMKSAHTFAVNQRALGVGVLGWHSYLQENMIAFDSLKAKGINHTIFKTIRERADQATIDLAVKLGEPPMLKGYKRRNITTLALAPTTSSSFILGQVSPSTEPLNSNYFTKDLAKGRFTYINPVLKSLLIEKGCDTAEIWRSILEKGGSVQHLNQLTLQEREVFKTFGEISQREIVIQAIQRQKFIDQGQSLNLMIPPQTNPKEVSDLLIYGWENGIKGFYYQRSANPSQELARSINECASCEG